MASINKTIQIYNIKIVLADNTPSQNTIIKQPAYETLTAPQVSLEGNLLSWAKDEGANEYHILQNGKLTSVTTENKFTINKNETNTYQVIVVDKKGIGSFACEPILFVP